MWLYGALIHHLHPTSWTGTYDPRLGGAVIIASHSQHKIGEVIPVDYNSLIFSSPSKAT
ncbi:MAG: CRISPR-associated protein Csx3 [Nitrososphaerota archaeon]